MPLAIPASASADGPSGRVTPRPGDRSRVAALVSLPSGRIGLALTTAVIAMALLAPVLTSLDPFALTGGPLLPPSRGHPMGTDTLGRDLFSGVLWGARTSLFVAGAVSTLAFAVGVTVGLVAGYRGGWVDDLLVRLAELLQVLPRFFLVVVALALFGPGVDRLVLTLGLTTWPLLARVVRGEALSLRRADFVLAAEASGATRARILGRTMLPNVLPHALVVAGLLFGQALLLEATLGFLGLGDANVMSWGLLAAQARSHARAAWWLPLFPGLAIAVAVLGVNLTVDAWSAALDRRG